MMIMQSQTSEIASLEVEPEHSCTIVVDQVPEVLSHEYSSFCPIHIITTVFIKVNT